MSRHLFTVLSTSSDCFEDVVQWYYVQLVFAYCWQIKADLGLMNFFNLAISILKTYSSLFDDNLGN
ncbi:hypothetical protein [Candidatus Protochlamydia sp. R18]|uniref:hypothetical protein n=1 Tax=Candidatus Protochlamydia sp. R18 TaxID=1353977 RepID=UPI0005A6553D|nr:hypothetical protein [Candidatus Protochlamydia sp. R18]